MGVVLGLFVALVFVLVPSDLLDVFDLRVHDRMMNLRGGSPGHEDLVLIGVDDVSLRVFGRWPWSRERHAELLDALTFFSSRIVFFDILFPERQEPALVSGELFRPDDRFAYSAANMGAVILANSLDFASRLDPDAADLRIWDTTAEAVILERFGFDFPYALTGRLKVADSAINPIPDLAESARGVGMINCEPDVDGVTRRVPLIADYNGRLFFHADLWVVCLWLGIDLADLVILPGEAIVIPAAPPIRVPIDEEGLLVVNYRSAEGRDPYFPEKTLSYYGIQAAFDHFAATGEDPPQLDTDTLAGKIVLVGDVAEGSVDARAVPFAVNYPMVGVHAHVIASILNRDFLYESPPWSNAMALVLLGLFTGLIVYRLSPLRALLFAVLLVALWIAFATGVFVQASFVMPMVRPVIVIVLTFALAVSYGFLLEERQRRWATTLLGSYVNEETIQEVIENPGLLNPGGRRAPVTILFSDIRGFTSLSEKIEAEQVVSLLNDYFGAMTEIIHRHDGTVDKFVGDEIMALFGAPKPLRNSALSAVRVAVEMQVAMRGLHDKWTREGRQAFGIAIGINTGDAVVGHIGTAKKIQYTAIGDCVNLANRLEVQAKAGEILVSRAVYDQVFTDFDAEALPPVKVKGKTEPVEVFAVRY